MEEEEVTEGPIVLQAVQAVQEEYLAVAAVVGVLIGVVATVVMVD
jgi:hypothetical protein